jgi:FAD synthase
MASSVPSPIVVQARPKPVTLIGEFDGVLPASLPVIDQAIDCARACGTTSQAVVIHNRWIGRFIMPPRRRCELLLHRGVMQAVVVDVDEPTESGRRVASIVGAAPDDTVYLDGTLSASLCTSVCAALGIETPVADIRSGRDAVIAALEAGNVRAAASLLGRCHDVLASATRSEHSWTAKPVDAPTVLPAPGRYVAEIRSRGKSERVTVSIGVDPALVSVMDIDHLDNSILPDDLISVVFVDRLTGRHEKTGAAT